MCGIAGLLLPAAGAASEAGIRAVERMAATLGHRGPDDAGVWADAPAGMFLGHRRLSIVDLSAAGHQPMASASGRFHVSYNGEVYNAPALRAALEAAGARFRGHSDTEVLLAAVEAWGVVPTLTRLIGMYALALWDREKKVLHLARDRMGEKPLYYGWIGGGLAFASELKALRSAPEWVGEIDRRALTLQLRFGYVPAPYAIYRGIYKLPPGTCLTVPAGDGGPDETFSPDAGPDDGGLHPVPYWSVRAAAERAAGEMIRSDTEAVDGLARLLGDAVRQQMVADVPLGAFLSGGIDSSTVVALMQAQSTRPVRTFSIGFDEPGYDEAAYAAEVARHLRTDHTELYVTGKEAMDLVPRLPEVYDEPFADSSQIPAMLVCALARRHVTVSLSGDGGDELFCGYNRYLWTERTWNAARRLPEALREGAAATIRAVPPRGWDRAAAVLDWIRGGDPRHAQPLVGDKLHKLARALGAPGLLPLYRGVVSYWPDPAALVRDTEEPDTVLAEDNRLPGARPFADQAMYWDQVMYLPDDNLVKMDRASMHVGLEARAPFLDHRVVEFAWRLPFAMKVRDGSTKWVLRQVLYRHVPRAMVERPKMGFSVPVGAWLRGPLRAWAEDLLDGSRMASEGVFRVPVVQAAWRDHLSGRRNLQHALWALLMFQAWQRAGGSAGDGNGAGD